MGCTRVHGDIWEYNTAMVSPQTQWKQDMLAYVIEDVLETLLVAILAAHPSLMRRFSLVELSVGVAGAKNKRHVAGIS